MTSRDDTLTVTKKPAHKPMDLALEKIATRLFTQMDRLHFFKIARGTSADTATLLEEVLDELHDVKAAIRALQEDASVFGYFHEAEREPPAP